MSKHFQRALGHWPKDLLRPHASFANVVKKRIETKPPTEAETNALFTLLENRYQKRYPLSKATWEPESDPEYYGRLQVELHEAPDRSMLERFITKVGSMIRMS